MLQSKNAIGNLIARYKSVLKSCHLINTFGSLALAGVVVVASAGVASAEIKVVNGGTPVTDYGYANGQMEAYIGASKPAQYVTVTGGTEANPNVLYGKQLIGDTAFDLNKVEIYTSSASAFLELGKSSNADTLNVGTVNISGSNAATLTITDKATVDTVDSNSDVNIIGAVLGNIDSTGSVELDGSAGGHVSGNGVEIAETAGAIGGPVNAGTGHLTIRGGNFEGPAAGDGASADLSGENVHIWGGSFDENDVTAGSEVIIDVAGQKFGDIGAGTDVELRNGIVTGDVIAGGDIDITDHDISSGTLEYKEASVSVEGYIDADGKIFVNTSGAIGGPVTAGGLLNIDSGDFTEGGALKGASVEIHGGNFDGNAVTATGTTGTVTILGTLRDTLVGELGAVKAAGDVSIYRGAVVDTINTDGDVIIKNEGTEAKGKVTANNILIGDPAGYEHPTADAGSATGGLKATESITVNTLGSIGDYIYDNVIAGGEINIVKAAATTWLGEIRSERESVTIKENAFGDTNPKIEKVAAEKDVTIADGKVVGLLKAGGTATIGGDAQIISKVEAGNVIIGGDATVGDNADEDTITATTGFIQVDGGTINADLDSAKYITINSAAITGDLDADEYITIDTDKKSDIGNIISSTGSVTVTALGDDSTIDFVDAHELATISAGTVGRVKAGDTVIIDGVASVQGNVDALNNVFINTDGDIAGAVTATSGVLEIAKGNFTGTGPESGLKGDIVDINGGTFAGSTVTANSSVTIDGVTASSIFNDITANNATGTIAVNAENAQLQGNLNAGGDITITKAGVSAIKKINSTAGSVKIEGLADGSTIASVNAAKEANITGNVNNNVIAGGKAVINGEIGGLVQAGKNVLLESGKADAVKAGKSAHIYGAVAGAVEAGDSVTIHNDGAGNVGSALSVDAGKSAFIQKDGVVTNLVKADENVTIQEGGSAGSVDAGLSANIYGAVDGLVKAGENVTVQKDATAGSVNAGDNANIYGDVTKFVNADKNVTIQEGASAESVDAGEIANIYGAVTKGVLAGSDINVTGIGSVLEGLTSTDGAITVNTDGKIGGDVKAEENINIIKATTDGIGAVESEYASVTIDNVGGGNIASVKAKDTATVNNGTVTDFVEGGSVAIGGDANVDGTVTSTVAGVDISTNGTIKGDVTGETGVTIDNATVEEDVTANAGDVIINGNAFVGKDDDDTIKALAGTVDINGGITSVAMIDAQNVDISGGDVDSIEIKASEDVIISGGNIGQNNAGTIVATETIDISNGKVDATEIRGADILISGGEVGQNLPVGTILATETVEISNGLVDAENISGADVLISGGTVKATTSITGANDVIISGGTVDTLATTATANDVIVHDVTGDNKLGTVMAGGNVDITNNVAGATVESGTIQAGTDASVTNVTVGGDVIATAGKATIDGTTTVSGEVQGYSVLIEGDAKVDGNVTADVTDVTINDNATVGKDSDDTIEALAGTVNVEGGTVLADINAKNVNISGGDVDAPNKIAAAEKVLISDGDVDATFIEGKNVEINGGTIGATATGDIIKALDGDIDINGGTITADINAKNDVNITDGDITTDSTGIIAGNSITMGTNTGTVDATKGGIYAIAGDIDINGGTIISSSIKADADDISIDGITGASKLGAVSTTTRGDINIGVGTPLTGAVEITSVNSAGSVEINADETSTVTSGPITAATDVDLVNVDVTGNIEATAGYIAIDGGKIDNATGTIKAGTDIDINDVDDGSKLGAVTAGAEVDINATTGTTVESGTITAGTAASVTNVTVGGDVIANAGKATIDGTTTVSGEVQGDSVLIEGDAKVDGNVTADVTDVTINDNATVGKDGDDTIEALAGTVDINGGTTKVAMIDAKNVDISGGDVDSAEIKASEDVIISGGNIGQNVIGTIIAEETVEISDGVVVASSISGADILISDGNVDSGLIEATDTDVIINGGIVEADINAKKDVNITAGEITTHANGIVAGNSITLGTLGGARDDLTIDATYGGITANAGSIDILSGKITASNITADGAGSHVNIGDNVFVDADLVSAENGTIKIGQLADGSEIDKTVSAKGATIEHGDFTVGEVEGKLDGNIILNGTHVTNGVISDKGNVIVGDAQDEAKGALIEGGINSKGGQVIVGGEKTVVKGGIESAGDLAVSDTDGAVIIKDNATIKNGIKATGDATVSVADKADVFGGITSEDGAIDITTSGEINGDINSSNADVTIDNATVDGNIDGKNIIIDGGNIGYDGTSSTITAQEMVDINGGDVIAKRIKGNIISITGEADDSVEGKLVATGTDGTVNIDTLGTVTGDIDAVGDITIDDGTVTADIIDSEANIDINGGNVTANDKINAGQSISIAGIAGDTVTGDLIAGSTVNIDTLGTVDGDIDAVGDITIEHGTVTADIIDSDANIDINGGNVTVADTLGGANINIDNAFIDSANINADGGDVIANNVVVGSSFGAVKASNNVDITAEGSDITSVVAKAGTASITDADVAEFVRAATGVTIDGTATVGETVTSGEGDILVTDTAVVEGLITNNDSAAGSVLVDMEAQVHGGIKTDAATVTVADSAKVLGDIKTTSGAVSLTESAIVDGNIKSDTGAIEINDSADVSGNVVTGLAGTDAATGDITMNGGTVGGLIAKGIANVVVNGGTVDTDGVSSENGNITIDKTGSLDINITGGVTTQDGIITLNDGTVDGGLKSTVGAIKTPIDVVNNKADIVMTGGTITSGGISAAGVDTILVASGAGDITGDVITKKGDLTIYSSNNEIDGNVEAGGVLDINGGGLLSDDKVTITGDVKGGKNSQDMNVTDANIGGNLEGAGGDINLDDTTVHGEIVAGGGELTIDGVTTTVGDIYGGKLDADVAKNTSIVINDAFEIGGDVYGGGHNTDDLNDDGKVEGNTNITVNGGTFAEKSHIFGGGNGAGATVGGDATIAFTSKGSDLDDDKNASLIDGYKGLTVHGGGANPDVNTVGGTKTLELGTADAYTGNFEAGITDFDVIKVGDGAVASNVVRNAGLNIGADIADQVPDPDGYYSSSDNAKQLKVKAGSTLTTSTLNVADNAELAGSALETEVIVAKDATLNTGFTKDATGLVSSASETVTTATVDGGAVKVTGGTWNAGAEIEDQQLKSYNKTAVTGGGEVTIEYAGKMVAGDLTVDNGSILVDKSALAAKTVALGNAAAAGTTETSILTVTGGANGIDIDGKGEYNLHITDSLGIQDGGALVMNKEASGLVEGDVAIEDGAEDFTAEIDLNKAKLTINGKLNSLNGDIALVNGSEFTVEDTLTAENGTLKATDKNTTLEVLGLTTLTGVETTIQEKAVAKLAGLETSGGKLDVLTKAELNVAEAANLTGTATNIKGGADALFEDTLTFAEEALTVAEAGTTLVVDDLTTLTNATTTIEEGAKVTLGDPLGDLTADRLLTSGEQLTVTGVTSATALADQTKLTVNGNAVMGKDADGNPAVTTTKITEYALVDILGDLDFTGADDTTADLTVENGSKLTVGGLTTLTDANTMIQNAAKAKLNDDLATENGTLTVDNSIVAVIGGDATMSNTTTKITNAADMAVSGALAFTGDADDATTDDLIVESASKLVVGGLTTLTEANTTIKQGAKAQLKAGLETENGTLDVLEGAALKVIGDTNLVDTDTNIENGATANLDGLLTASDATLDVQASSNLIVSGLTTLTDVITTLQQGAKAIIGTSAANADLETSGGILRVIGDDTLLTVNGNATMGVDAVTKAFIAEGADVKITGELDFTGDAILGNPDLTVTGGGTTLDVIGLTTLTDASTTIADGATATLQDALTANGGKLTADDNANLIVEKLTTLDTVDTDILGGATATLNDALTTTNGTLDVNNATLTVAKAANLTGTATTITAGVVDAQDTLSFADAALTVTGADATLDVANDTTLTKAITLIEDGATATLNGKLTASEGALDVTDGATLTVAKAADLTGTATTITDATVNAQDTLSFADAALTVEDDAALTVTDKTTITGSDLDIMNGAEAKFLGGLDFTGDGLETAGQDINVDEAFLNAGATNIKKAIVDINASDVLLGATDVRESLVNVTDSLVVTDVLTAKDSTFFIDPSIMQVAAIKDEGNNKFYVSKGSTLQVGAGAGVSDPATTNAFVVAAGQQVELKSDSKLIVDKDLLDADGTFADGTSTVKDHAGLTSDTDNTNEAAYFGEDAALMVDVTGHAAGNSALTITGSDPDQEANRNVAVLDHGAKVIVKGVKAPTTLAAGDQVTLLHNAGTNEKIIYTHGADPATAVADFDRVNDLKLDAAASTDDTLVYTNQVGDDSTNFGVAPELFDTMQDIWTNKENSVYHEDDGIRFLSRLASTGFTTTDEEAAQAIDSVAHVSLGAGVAGIAIDASTMVEKALNRRLDDERSNTQQDVVVENGTSTMVASADGQTPYVDPNNVAVGVWATPLYQQSDVDGMKAGGLEGGYDSKLAGAIIGADLSNDSIRFGAALSLGAGNADSQGDFLSTSNDVDFWGMSLYSGYDYKNFGAKLTASYTKLANDISQDGGTAFNALSTDIDVDVYTVGLGLDYTFNIGSKIDVIPHVGVRYTAVHQDGYTSQVDGNDVFSVDSATMDNITIPVGVTVTGDFVAGDWTVEPRLDLSYIAALEDREIDNEVTIGATGFKTNGMSAEVLDESTFAGSLGLELGKGHFTIGLDYDIEASENRLSHAVFGTLRYDF